MDYLLLFTCIDWISNWIKPIGYISMADLETLADSFGKTFNSSNGFSSTVSTIPVLSQANFRTLVQLVGYLTSPISGGFLYFGTVGTTIPVLSQADFCTLVQLGGRYHISPISGGFSYFGKYSCYHTSPISGGLLFFCTVGTIGTVPVLSQADFCPLVQAAFVL